MKERLKDILLGLADGALPSLSGSITKDTKGNRDINFARLVAAVLSWFLLIAVCAGWIKLSAALEVLKILLM